MMVNYQPGPAGPIAHVRRYPVGEDASCYPAPVDQTNEALGKCPVCYWRQPLLQDGISLLPIQASNNQQCPLSAQQAVVLWVRQEPVQRQGPFCDGTAHCRQLELGTQRVALSRIELQQPELHEMLDACAHCAAAAPRLSRKWRDSRRMTLCH